MTDKILTSIKTQYHTINGLPSITCVCSSPFSTEVIAEQSVPGASKVALSTPATSPGLMPLKKASMLSIVLQTSTLPESVPTVTLLETATLQEASDKLDVQVFSIYIEIYAKNVRFCRTGVMFYYWHCKSYNVSSLPVIVLESDISILMVAKWRPKFLRRFLFEFDVQPDERQKCSRTAFSRLSTIWVTSPSLSIASVSTSIV